MFGKKRRNAEPKVNENLPTIDTFEDNNLGDGEDEYFDMMLDYLDSANNQSEEPIPSIVTDGIVENDFDEIDEEQIEEQVEEQLDEKVEEQIEEQLENTAEASYEDLPVESEDTYEEEIDSVDTIEDMVEDNETTSSYGSDFEEMTEITNPDFDAENSVEESTEEVRDEVDDAFDDHINKQKAIFFDDEEEEDEGSRKKKSKDQTPFVVKFIGIILALTAVAGVVLIVLGILFLMIMPIYEKDGMAGKHHDYHEVSSDTDALYIMDDVLVIPDIELTDTNIIDDLATSTDAPKTTEAPVEGEETDGGEAND